MTLKFEKLDNGKYLITTISTIGIERTLKIKPEEAEELYERLVEEIVLE